MTGDASTPLWTPSDVDNTQTVKFRKCINKKYGLSLGTYQELHEWSITHRADFWASVWEYENIIGTLPPTSSDTSSASSIVDEKATPRDNPQWSEGATLNWAENQLRHSLSHPDDIAIIQTSEPCSAYSPSAKHITQRQLRAAVGKVQRAMKAIGMEKGDRVAWYGGNCFESVVVLLATASLGGIFSSAAADFGVDGVIERLEQIRPKLLFVTNAVVYAGTPRPLLPLLPKLFGSLTSPPVKTIIIPHIPFDIVPIPSDLSSSDQVTWDDFLSSESSPGGTDGEGKGEGEIEFEQVDFNDPIWILFSSGTTGRPKAIVHRAGGMLLDSLREHHIAGDISRGDVYFYYTTPGWMMFQYLVSGLATGATIVLYEGSPLKRPETLWEMVDELKITILGTSAKWIEQISKVYPDVKSKHVLSSLKQILSTGSPLAPSLFDFVYENVKKDVLLGSITGGSDICSVFAGRNTSLPVFRGEIQSKMLGFALDVEADEPGLPGELVCRQAFPIEPLGFWPLPGYGFPDKDVQSAQERFLDSYFKDEKGTWYHGDYVQITPSQHNNGGGVIMLGRSDGVLNPGGIRFGPTDIYSVLDTDEFHALGLEETLVVGLMVDQGTDEKVILFVKLKEGQKLDEGLMKKIKTAIRLARSARHVPGKVLQVSDVPVTLTGKRVEVPIRKVINGALVSSINPATLRNPECLEEYVKLGEDLRKEENVV